MEGKGEELQRWFAIISDLAARFEGFQAAQLFETVADGGKEWLSIFTFDTPGHLDAWLNSTERKDQLAAGADLFHPELARQQMVGLEFWFDDPKGVSSVPPPKWKMAIVTGVIILILLNTLISWLSALLARLHFPGWTIGICSVGVLICLMTWLIMPGVTRVLRVWLRA